MIIISPISLFGQSSIFDRPVPYNSFYNKKNADSLVNRGIYNFICGPNFDFRKMYCIDSIAKKYNFNPITYQYSGCDPTSYGLTDSMRWFNNFMNTHLEKLNGLNWKRDFDNDLENCSNKVCCSKQELDSFLYTSQFGGGLMFNLNESNLSSITCCIIDHTLIPILVKYPSIKIELIGYKSPQELSKVENISYKRAKNIKDYLEKKGISKNRVGIKINKEIFTDGLLRWKGNYRPETLIRWNVTGT